MNCIIDCLEDRNIKYKIEKKNLKRLTIKYLDNGTLLIKQPLSLTDEKMISFVNNHIDWIEKHRLKTNLSHDSYHDGDEYLLFGKIYKLEIAYSNHQEVIKLDDKIIIYTANDKNIFSLLNAFRYEIAENVLNELLNKCFFQMQLNIYPKLVIKESKRLWGACYYKENKIMLNVSLIHLPFNLIEYVIYHELTHFVYHDHSPSFHAYLGKYVENEKEVRKKLKNYSVNYH